MPDESSDVTIIKTIKLNCELPFLKSVKKIELNAIFNPIVDALVPEKRLFYFIVSDFALLTHLDQLV